MLPQWVTFGEIPSEMRDPDTYVLVGLIWLGIAVAGVAAATWVLRGF